MAALRLQRIREYLSKAYESGFHGCLDLKEECIDEIMAEVTSEVQAVSDEKADFRVYTIQEMRKMPLGTIFEHARHGRGWLDGTDANKSMTFENGDNYQLVANEDPWDEPMRLVGRLNSDGK